MENKHHAYLLVNKNRVIFNETESDLEEEDEDPDADQ